MPSCRNEAGIDYKGSIAQKYKSLRKELLSYHGQNADDGGESVFELKSEVFTKEAHRVSLENTKGQVRIKTVMTSIKRNPR